jgi:CRP/FNR family transcriptional regulator, anaerobic regulatory protein
MQVACSDCNLSRFCLPSGMQPREIETLSDAVRRNRPVHKGDIVYRAGDLFNGLFALKSGTAKLVHVDAAGNESIISLMLPGELLGFDGLASGRYACSLIALETSSYCELPAHQLPRLSQFIPTIHSVLLQRAGKKFEDSIRRMALIQRPAEERLAAFVLDLSVRLHARGFSQMEFRISLTRQEIGDHLGLALETVSRLFGHFEALGLIQVQGKLIRILNVDALRGYSPH